MSFGLYRIAPEAWVDVVTRQNSIRVRNGRDSRVQGSSAKAFQLRNAPLEASESNRNNAKHFEISQQATLLLSSIQSY